ncbi:hypothetical protein AB0H28_28870 [Micromonospora sp. NPDC050980]|uniref:hypothetical protein n=1 Tax=Micromonospora sp. NPDC050980 TaxID=3155161 RepID=UPI0033D54E1F
MTRHRSWTTALTGLLCAALVGCSSPARPHDSRSGDRMLPNSWREQAAARVADLIYPGQAYPTVSRPIDPAPTLYADAARVLARAGQLSATDRRRATRLLVRWWPTTDPDGFHWVTLTRALAELGTLDQLPSTRLSLAVAWARAVLARPGETPTRTLTAAADVVTLARSAGAPAGSGTDALLRAVAGARPCSGARTLPALAERALLATTTGTPCPVPPALRRAAQSQLDRSAGPSADRLGRAVDVTELAVLARVGVLDRAPVLAAATTLLATSDTDGRGGDLGQVPSRCWTASTRWGVLPPSPSLRCRPCAGCCALRSACPMA